MCPHPPPPGFWCMCSSSLIFFSFLDCPFLIVPSVFSNVYIIGKPPGINRRVVFQELISRAVSVDSLTLYLFTFCAKILSCYETVSRWYFQWDMSQTIRIWSLDGIFSETCPRQSESDNICILILCSSQYGMGVTSSNFCKGVFNYIFLPFFVFST